MSLLEYISDEDLFNEVETLLTKAKKKKDAAEKTFTSNVIDPFGALFEAPGFSSHEEWRNSELARQQQKTIQNHVGTFHQKILGHVEGWRDMGIGGIVDLLNEERRIIAEVKNKYSTVTGGDLADKYKGLDELVSPKHSRFKDYCAYFVNIIPRKPIRYNSPFTLPIKVVVLCVLRTLTFESLMVRVSMSLSLADQMLCKNSIVLSLTQLSIF